MSNSDEQTGLGRFKKTLGRAAEQGADAVSKAAKRADQAMTSGAERAGVSDQLNTARDTAKRSAEIMSGSDIRQHNEFTDAVTRVLMGLHRDTVEQAARIEALEQTVGQLQQSLNEGAK